MSIELVFGPMFSGKTTTLLSYEKKFKNSNKLYMCINHSFDKRYTTDGKLATHDGNVSECKTLCASSLKDIEDEMINPLQGIIIDEVQFFDGIDEFAEKWASKGKIVVCGGLNSDFRMKPFDNISKLIPKCDKIIHLKSLCVDCGGEAPFTERTIKSEEQTLVGTGDIYKPKCRKCHHIY